MATYHSLYIFILLLFSLCISKSGGLKVERIKAQRFSPKSNEKRKLQNLVRKLDDETINPPITNPANFPPYTPTPTIVTIPGTNPTAPVNPQPTTTAPTTTPTTTDPATTTPTQPIINPANPGNTPVVYPVNQPTTSTNAPATQGQTWCIAKSGAPESSLQDALNYACGIGGADCSEIQEGGSCYDPNSLENHASFAFNSYYQKNPSPTSCDFGGTAVLVNTNPSTGSCIYPSSGTTAAVPLTTNPPTTETPSSTIPTPTTSSPGTTVPSPYGVLPAGTNGSPPSFSNPSNPNSLFPASYGPDSPPSVNSLPAGSVVSSDSTVLRSRIVLVILVGFCFTGMLVLGN